MNFRWCVLGGGRSPPPRFARGWGSGGKEGAALPPQFRGGGGAKPPLTACFRRTPLRRAPFRRASFRRV